MLLVKNENNFINDFQLKKEKFQKLYDLQSFFNIKIEPWIKLCEDNNYSNNEVNSFCENWIKKEQTIPKPMNLIKFIENRRDFIDKKFYKENINNYHCKLCLGINFIEIQDENGYIYAYPCNHKNLEIPKNYKLSENEKERIGIV
jgi:hypothetical protein